MPPLHRTSDRQPDRLSAIFAALTDPTRRAMLVRLAQNDLSVGELAAPFAMSLPAISKHLKVLERAGLVKRGRDAQWRPCRIDAEALKPAVAWLGQFALLWDSIEPVRKRRSRRS